MFVRHTRTKLPDRLLKLVRSVVPSARFLDVRKVPTKKREAWIDRRVNEPEVPVLLVKLNAVRTGLNNLVGFSTAIWYELDYSAFTYRQAIGRLHRIGQRREVTIRIPYYVGTAQDRVPAGGEEGGGVTPGRRARRAGGAGGGGGRGGVAGRVGCGVVAGEGGVPGAGWGRAVRCRGA